MFHPHPTPDTGRGGRIHAGCVPNNPVLGLCEIVNGSEGTLNSNEGGSRLQKVADAFTRSR